MSLTISTKPGMPGDIDIAKVKENINNLSDDRANNYEDWLNVGLAISYELKEDGRDIWHEFSSRCSSKYNKTECDKTYNGFLKGKSSNPLTIGSIMMWSKEDNYKNYMTIQLIEMI